MADQVKNAAGSAGNSWNKMSEDQKKQTFDSLPQEKKQGKSYMEWVKDGYHNQYENWMPWIEDQYLKWFTNDNKTSYAAKGELYLQVQWTLDGPTCVACCHELKTDINRQQTLSTRPRSPASSPSTRPRTASTTLSPASSVRAVPCRASATLSPKRA
jgi:hypothetical protein